MQVSSLQPWQDQINLMKGLLDLEILTLASFMIRTLQTQRGHLSPSREVVNKEAL